MLTTITVNGSEGLRFLTSLAEARRPDKPVPPALVAMIEHINNVGRDDLDHVSLQIAAPQAEEIAAFVDELAGGSTPLLFSAQIGDLVILVRDVLAEISVGKREARTWQFLRAGSIGRLLGHRGDLGKLLLLEGGGPNFPVREHAYVSDRCTTRARSR